VEVFSIANFIEIKAIYALKLCRRFFTKVYKIQLKIMPPPLELVFENSISLQQFLLKLYQLKHLVSIVL